MLPRRLFSVLLSTSLRSGEIPASIVQSLRSFDLEIHDFPDTGRGLRTTRDRLSSDILLKVPNEHILSAVSALQQYPYLRKAAEAVQKANENREIEKKLSDEQVLALALCQMRNDGIEYAVSLPPQHSVLTMPNYLKECLPAAYMKLIDATQQYALDLHSSACAALKLSNDTKSPFTVPTSEEFLWAFATVRSRSVSTDGAEMMNDPEDNLTELIAMGGGGQFRALLPAFDLLNHRVGERSTHGSVDRHFELRSMQPYSAGDQVFISYGDERDNVKLLLTYGFCLQDNPEAVAFFDMDDVLAACSKARPTLFLPEIVSQLKVLIAKVVAEEDGGNQALFAFDGRTSVPRPSLTRGITMLSQICMQLGGEAATDHFSQHVLEALLENRRQEIAQKRKQLEQAIDVDASWKAMADSIKVLLLSEEGIVRNDLHSTYDLNKLDLC